MSYVQFSSVIPQKPSVIFNYITDMNKYITLLPGDLSLTLDTPAEKMKCGSEYKFQMKRFGISRPWLIKIDDYKKNEYFAEYETSHVFSNWRHECRLQKHGQQNTLMANHIEYTFGFGLVGKIADDIWIRKDFKRILQCVHQKLIVSL